MLTVANSDPAHNASLPDGTCLKPDSGKRDNSHEVHPLSGLESIGRLTRDKFYEEISSSKVLIGIGRPFLSPSPYDVSYEATTHSAHMKVMFHIRKLLT